MYALATTILAWSTTAVTLNASKKEVENVAISDSGDRNLISGAKISRSSHHTTFPGTFSQLPFAAGFNQHRSWLDDNAN